MATQFYVGTSGWHYDHWRERFYPKEIPKAKWLDFYARSFNTVELNNSFYHLPTEKAFENWRDSAPANFAFAVKVSRLITHMKKLRNTDEPLSNFFERAYLLNEKLGPLLYQLPPNLKRDDSRLKNFIASLPKDRRHVFEFRHHSWFDANVLDLLRYHNIGFCIFDMPDFTTPHEVTADFLYIRFHGSNAMYGSCYSDSELEDWAQKIRELTQNVSITYIYFNNDAEGFAVRNALALEQMLRLT